MRRTMSLGVIALMCVAGAAGAQGQASPTPAQIVAARQAAFDMSAATLGAIKAGLDAGAPAQQLGFAATGLNRWSVALPTMFPQGTGSDTLGAATKAKPEIWTNRADFEAKAAAYATATGQLKDAIAAGDTAAANTAFAATRAACGSCHEAYRE